jgi:AcrR family transcriptional regulator
MTKAKSAPRRRTTVDAEQRLRTAADALGASERRLERSPVLGPRAERTRRLIIDSAWELFRTRGYTGTTVADIAKHAKVSLATFYQYFSELNDVLAVIVVDFIKDSLERGLDRWDVRAGRDGLRQMIDKSMASYIDNRDFMELWETATLVSPRIRSLSLDYARVYRQRFEGFIREGVELGLVRGDVDPAGMADAMTTMLVRYCFEHFVLSDERVPADRSAMVELLTEMWADAIKLVDVAAAKPRGRK